jgi:hypothetical protein
MQQATNIPSYHPRRSSKAHTYHPVADHELTSMQRAAKRQETMLLRLYSF